MAPRSNWKGYLKLSLVSCPVQLFPATSTKDRVSFHRLNRETGNRLRQRLVDEGTEQEVDSSDQVKGYEVAKNEYLVLEEGELDSVAIESSHTIDIETFVPRTDIDEAYLDSPYYLVPDGKLGGEAFAVIRDAMREKNVVGIGRVVLFRRERPIMLEARGKGLIATTLRYAYEVRKDEEYFGDIQDVPVDGEMLDLATHIIGRKMSHFDPKRFEDRYQNAVLELIKAKQHNQPVKAAAAPAKPGNVVSLMDALRKSIAGDQDNAPAKSPKKSAAKTASKPKAETKSAQPEPAAKPEAGGAEPAGKAKSPAASTKRRAGQSGRGRARAA